MLSTVVAILIAFSHPLILVLTLVTQTLRTIILIYHQTQTPWVGIIIFLIFLGGLLIIFSYLSALVPNEIFFSNKLGLFFLLTPWLISIFLLDPWSQNNNLILEIIRGQHNFSIIPFCLRFIILILCVIIYLCLSIKTPIKQENY